MFLEYTNFKTNTTMIYTLPDLPYANDALAPSISRETVEYHYGKHEKTYIDNLNRLIKDTPYEDMELEEIITSASGALFNKVRYSIMRHRHGTIFFISSPSLLMGHMNLTDICARQSMSSSARSRNSRKNSRMLGHRFSVQAGCGFPKIRMASYL